VGRNRSVRLGSAEDVDGGQGDESGCCNIIKVE